MTVSFSILSETYLSLSILIALSGQVNSHIPQAVHLSGVGSTAGVAYNPTCLDHLRHSSPFLLIGHLIKHSPQPLQNFVNIYILALPLPQPSKTMPLCSCVVTISAPFILLDTFKSLTYVAILHYTAALSLIKAMPRSRAL